MKREQFESALEKFDLTVAAQFGNRREYVQDDLRGLGPAAMKREIERLRADRVVLTAFVTEDGADAQVKEALEFIARKMDFKGDVVPSQRPASNGRNYYFIANEPRKPLIGQGFFDDEDFDD